MRIYIIAAILLGLVVAGPLQAVNLNTVTKTQYLEAASSGMLQAGIQGKVGGAFLGSNPNQSSLKELGIYPGSSGPSTTDFNWPNSAWTPVNISWNQSMFNLDVGNGACILSMQVVPFERVYLVVNSVNFVNDGKIQLTNITVDGVLFPGFLSVNARGFRGIAFSNFSTSTTHNLKFDVMFSSTDNQPPFDDDLEFQAVFVGVPEPGCVALVVIGSVFLCSLRCRKKNV